jgi:hypothetical protein
MIEIRFSLEEGTLHINGALACENLSTMEEESLPSPGAETQYTVENLVKDGGLDSDEFTCLMFLMQRCFPGWDEAGKETTHIDKFLCGIDTEIPLPDLGVHTYSPRRRADG